MTRTPIMGAAAAVILAAAVVLADPYWFRATSNQFGLQAVDDAHLRRVEADFLQRFQDRACLSWECIMRALEQVPKTESLLYPFKVVVIAPAVAAGSPWSEKPLDSAAINVAVAGFPAPTHGVTPMLLLCLPVVLILSLPYCAPAFLALVAIVLTITGIDLTIRMLVERLIGPGVPVLWLLPQYMSRASSVFFNQALWVALASGVYFALIKASNRARWWIPVLVIWCLALGTAAVSSVADLRTEWARVRVTVGGRLTLQDVEDLVVLERGVPANESYLVSSSALVMGKENWVDSLLDEAASLYAQASRPSLFLFFQSYGSQYTATDLQGVCDQLTQGVKYPEPITRHRARWIVELSGSALEGQSPRKTLCGRPVTELFPEYRAVAAKGRIVLYRLW